MRSLEILAAVEVLHETRSRRVVYRDIRIPNVLLVPVANNCLQILFVDFDNVTTWASATKDEKKPKMYAQGHFCILYQLLLRYLNVPQKKLRALSCESLLPKFLDVAGIKATCEEQHQAMIRTMISQGGEEQSPSNWLS